MARKIKITFEVDETRSDEDIKQELSKIYAAWYYMKLAASDFVMVYKGRDVTNEARDEFRRNQ